MTTSKSPSPSPPVLHGPGLTDVRMMTVAHSNFRRELGLSPEAVRSVPDGNRRRTTVICAHVGLFLGLLHHHHSIEDEMLWGALLQRVPQELAPLVHLMEQQHEIVAALMIEANDALATWRASAAQADAEPLAAILTRLCAALFEHLQAEEEYLLPIMARQITAQEWAAFTEAGMSSIPKGMLLIGFGMMLYEGDPAAIALEIRNAPAPLRGVLPVLGRRAFRRYARKIHGTSTPRRGVGAAVR